MITLPNGCSCSNLTVYPKNWLSKNARFNKDWFIKSPPTQQCGQVCHMAMLLFGRRRYLFAIDNDTFRYFDQIRSLRESAYDVQGFLLCWHL